MTAEEKRIWGSQRARGKASERWARPRALSGAATPDPRRPDVVVVVVVVVDDAATSLLLCSRCRLWHCSSAREPSRRRGSGARGGSETSELCRPPHFTTTTTTTASAKPGRRAQTAAAAPPPVQGFLALAPHSAGAANDVASCKQQTHVHRAFARASKASAQPSCASVSSLVRL